MRVACASLVRRGERLTKGYYTIKVLGLACSRGL